MKRVLSWLLVLTMVFSMVPMAAFADGMPSGTVTLQSENGETHVETWTAPANGTLTVSMGAATPGWSYTIEGVTLPITGSEAASNSYQVTGGTTYTIIFEAYNPTAWSQANGTVSYALSFVEGEVSEDGPVTKEAYVISDTALVVGDNAVTLSNDLADATVFAFAPTETGIYTITADNASAVVGYWGSNEYFLNDQGTNSCNCTGVGQTHFFGVSGVDSCTLTIAKSGDVQEIVWDVYENKNDPAMFVYPCYKIVDGEGDNVLVNFDHSALSITAMLGTGSARYSDPENGIYIDYTNALTAYANAAAANGGYTYFTEDLYEMLPRLYVSKGWDYQLDSWEDLLVSYVEDHTNLRTEVDADGYEWVYCDDCNFLVSTDCPGYYYDNPIILTFDADGTYELTLEPYSGYYFGVYNRGKEMTVNGEKFEFMIPSTSPMYEPSIFFMGNDTDTAVTYELALITPVGTMDNPEVIEELFYSSFDVSLEAGDSDGYFYTYTAEGDGQVTFYFNNITEGVEGDIVVTNTNTYAQRALLADGVDNYGLELVVEVSEGDVLQIQVLVVPDVSYNIAAADISWFGTFAAKQGTEANPYPIFDSNYETEAVIEYTAEVPAGETTYFQGYGLNDTTLTFDAENMVVAVDGVEVDSGYVIPAATGMFAPVSITVTNNGNEDASIDMEFTYAIGTSVNPAELVIGENVVELSEGNTGYYYSWTATEDTELTVVVSGSSWMYTVNKTPADPDNYADYVYGDPHWHNDEPVVASETIAVKAGDVVDVFVQTYDPADEYGWNPLPAGTITVTASLPTDEETPVVAGPFKMYIEQTNLGKILYVTGEMSGYYGATSEVAAEGKDFYTETTSEGTRIYYLDGEAKTYIEIIASGTYRNVKFNAEPSIYYTYNAEYDTYLTDVEGTDYFLGTYGTYNTVSASKASYLESGNFPVHLCDPDNLPVVPEEPEQPEDPEADSELTIEEAIALGESKDHNTYTEGKYYVTGTIKEVYSEKYGNMYVIDEAGNQLTIYGSYNADGTAGYSSMDVKPVAGDTVVLYGIIGQYNGTPQMKNAWIVDFQCGHALTHFDAVEPGCHYNGNIEYWTCSKCGGYWTDEALTVPSNSKNVVLPATGSNLLVHMDAVEPGCHYDGNQEYWICYECNQVWTDEALTQLTNIKNVVLPAVGGEVTHVEAVEPGCETEGNIEYWFCDKCEKVWTDEALTYLSNMMSVKLAPEHTNLVHMEAVEPGCHYNGNIEYWVCYDCGGHWTDELCRFPTNSKSVVVPATNDDSLLVHMDAIEPGCHYNGQVEHWICYNCNQVWTDEALTVPSNIKNVVLPYTNEPEAIHVEAKEPTCFEEGNVEYWYCEECEQVWTDEALTVPSNLKNVKLAALEHANVVHMEAVEPGCHYNGNIEYWICYDCEQVWQDEALTQLTNIKNVVLPYVGSNLLVHMEAVEPGCHDDGCIEHWICYECEQVWADEALTQLTNIKNVVLPAVGGDVVHVEAVEPGCETEGNIEHWYCEKCEKVWTDEALTQLSNHMNVKLAPTHTNLVHMEAVEPGCHDNGNIEYWVCYDCGGHWTDELCRFPTNSKSVVLPATGEGNVVHMEAVEPGCHYDGNTEYWICYDCEKVWADEALTQLTNIKNIVVPELGGDVIHVEAVEPGCETEGNIEYWYCEECEQVWADEARTQLTNFMNVKLAPTHTNLVHMEAVEPGCHYNGNIEYWVCYDCGGHWTDELCRFPTNAKSVVLPMTNEGHVVHVEAVEPTCQNGNIEYWYCEDCEQVWQNEELTQLTNFRNVIVPATGEHAVDMDKLIWKWTTETNTRARSTTYSATAVAYGVCANCGETVTWDANVVCKTTEYKDEKYKDYDAVTVIDTYTATVVVNGVEYSNIRRVVHATCFGAGYTEYFGRVERNGKVYDYGTKGSGNVLERVAKLKHTIVEDKDGNPYCSVCGTVNPSTGDMIMVSVIVMILAGAAVVFMLSKKRRNA